MVFSICSLTSFFVATRSLLHFPALFQFLQLLLQSFLVVFFDLFNDFVPIDNVSFRKKVIQNGLVSLTQILLQQQMIGRCFCIVFIVQYLLFQLPSIQVQLFHFYFDLLFIRNRRETLDYTMHHRNRVVFTKLMISDLVDCSSFKWIYLQYYTQNTLQLFTRVVWNFIFTLFDHFEKLHRLAMIKRQISKAHCVQNDSSTPNIYLQGIIRPSRQHLWRSIAWASTSSRQVIPFAVNATKPKVNKLQVEFVVKQDVFRLEVTMNNSQLVQIVDSIQQLLQKLTGFKLTQFFILDYMLKHLAPARILSNQIIVPMIFKDFVKLYDIRMPRFSQYLKLFSKPILVGLAFDFLLFNKLDGNLLI